MRLRIQPLVCWFLAFAWLVFCVALFISLPWWLKLIAAILTVRSAHILWRIASPDRESDHEATTRHWGDV